MTRPEIFIPEKNKCINDINMEKLRQFVGSNERKIDYCLQIHNIKTLHFPQKITFRTHFPKTYGSFLGESHTSLLSVIFNISIYMTSNI